MAEILLGVKDACSCCLRQSESLYDTSLGVLGEPSPENMLESCFGIKIVHAPGDVVMVCELCKNRLMHSWDLLVTVRNTQNRFVNFCNYANVDLGLKNIKLELRDVDEYTHSVKTELDVDRSNTNAETKKYISRAVPKSDGSEDGRSFSEIKLETADGSFDRKFIKKIHLVEPKYLLGADGVSKCKRPSRKVKRSFRKTLKDIGGVRKPAKLKVGKTSEEDLRIWLSRRKGSNDRTCPICKNHFNAHNFLAAHMSVHFPNHVCRQCGKRFAFKAAYAAHVQEHRAGPVYVCDACGKSYRLKTSLKQHIHIVHMKNRYEFRCPHCPDLFNNRYGKVKHLAQAHGDRSNMHTCAVCSRTFHMAGTLNRHINRTHLQHKRILCSVCGLWFYDKNTLDKHMFAHSSERRYSCDVCGNAFVKKWSLIGHLQTHAEKFQCDVCERRFPDKCILARHLKTHVIRAETPDDTL